ncbi:MAG TPA: radical SAM protein, partial [Desulfobulbaceae bacterium]|nr:radical SAM protein [Desulfobulbaceae bacterium]
IVNFLYARHVRVVELGGQSLDDSVLQNSRRGHSAADVVQASTMLKNAGMELGIQLMVGLPGQNFSSLRGTTDQVVSLAPDFVRIYPVLVVAGSGLARWYKRGEYRPLTLTRAVLQTAWMKKKLMAAGIRVVRMGLQPGRDLEKALLAGPYHPAFGELVNARLMLQQTRKLLSGVGPGQKVLIGISNRDLSVFKGIRQANIQRLTRLGLFDRFTLQTDPQQPRGTMKLITPD